MTISLNQVGKRYQNHWVFKGVDYTFEAGSRYALLGANGSGKSTLMRVIAGMQHVNKGTLQYTLDGSNIAMEQVFRYISYCAPGMDLVEEMTIEEFLHFHFTFKAIRPSFTVAAIIAEMGMQSAARKFIHECSSGMKQRVKLAQAFFCDSRVLLLDEPCSNLDLQGVAMYSRWLEQYAAGRLVIIASNDEREYEGVPPAHILSVQDYHA
jgi:ABC-type multidrug transport system ATPase subunit